MGCGNCKDKRKALNVDSRGNQIVENNPPPKKEKSQRIQKDITYKEYIEQKEDIRKKTKIESDNITRTLSDDTKRIMIDNLVGIYNGEEVSPLRLAPEQALMSLWNIVHNEDYISIVNEFNGLREQVDTLYEELKNKKIKLFWNK